ncbi:MAG TPA: sodium:solute symporter family protein [Clostridiaceae bacterium]|nr:sodium:solute symporter family protein [Clostridiaceae bacterium]
MLFSHFIGVILVLLLVSGLSIYSGYKNKQNYKQKGSSIVVSGLIIGTLVGGSSTIGTAQLAYSYGMSAWWFTLGGGIACLILAVFYVKPLRKTGCYTLVEILSKEYGNRVGFSVSLLSSLGTFINIISQLIASIAVIEVVFPQLPIQVTIAISAVFMIIYVVFGGTTGAGMVGALKTIFLYIAMIACGVLVLNLSGGIASFIDLVKGIDNPQNVHFFSLFARGVNKDLSACLSLILGVVSTQTYAQAIFAGKSDRAGIKGSLISAFLIPPIGIGGILAGLYMRAVNPGLSSKNVLMAFVIEEMPPILGGIIIGTLFIAVIGTGAGLALGVATTIKNDVIHRLSSRSYSEKGEFVLLQILIVITLVFAGILSAGGIGDIILEFAFMSMGLRGAVVFAPLCGALWFSGKVDRKYVLGAVIAAPICVLIFNTIIKLPIDSLFLGIIVSIVIMIAGFLRKK